MANQTKKGLGLRGFEPRHAGNFLRLFTYRSSLQILIIAFGSILFEHLEPAALPGYATTPALNLALCNIYFLSCSRLPADFLQSCLMGIQVERQMVRHGLIERSEIPDIDVLRDQDIVRKLVAGAPELLGARGPYPELPHQVPQARVLQHAQALRPGSQVEIPA